MEKEIYRLDPTGDYDPNPERSLLDDYFSSDNFEEDLAKIPNIKTILPIRRFIYNENEGLKAFVGNFYDALRNVMLVYYFETIIELPQPSLISITLYGEDKKVNELEQVILNEAKKVTKTPFLDRV